MSTIAERIQEIIDAGFSQSELARAAGVTKGSSNQWLSGGIKSIKLQYAQGIESLTGFKANWIVTGKGEKKRGDEARERQANNQEETASNHSTEISEVGNVVTADEVIEVILGYRQSTHDARRRIREYIRAEEKVSGRLALALPALNEPK